MAKEKDAAWQRLIELYDKASQPFDYEWAINDNLFEEFKGIVRNHRFENELALKILDKISFEDPLCGGPQFEITDLKRIVPLLTVTQDVSDKCVDKIRLAFDDDIVTGVCVCNKIEEFLNLIQIPTEFENIHRELEALCTELETKIRLDEFKELQSLALATSSNKGSDNRHPVEDIIKINPRSSRMAHRGLAALLDSDQWVLTGSQIKEKRISLAQDDEDAAHALYNAISTEFPEVRPYLRFCRGNVHKNTKPEVFLNDELE